MANWELKSSFSAQIIRNGVLSWVKSGGKSQSVWILLHAVETWLGSAEVIVKVNNRRSWEDLIDVVSWRLQRGKIKEVLGRTAVLRALATIAICVVLLMQSHESLDSILDSSLFCFLQSFVLLRRVRFINWSCKTLNLVFGLLILLLLHWRLFKISIFRHRSNVSSLRFGLWSSSSLLSNSFQNFVSWFFKLLALEWSKFSKRS